MVKTTRRQKPPATKSSNKSWEIDPELLDPKYNEIRRPSLPYGIVINSNPAGILIPHEQLLKAEWFNPPPEEDLTTVELTEEVTGLLLSKCRMVVLAFVPEYVRWKDIEENGEQAGSFIALYNDYRPRLDKKTQEVCSEHALVFLNAKKEPLHQIPIVVRFKNVSLWSFKSAREEFYRALEKAFADYTGNDYSGKSDKWRSLGILHIEFRAVKEGEGRNKSFCCKTHRIIPPTVGNFPKLFLGQPQKKQQVWEFHHSIAGFIDSSNELPALAASAEPEVEVLPPGKNGSRKGRKIRTIQQVDSEEAPDFDALDFEEERDFE